MAFFISGEGTIMEAILEAMSSGKLPGVEPAIVIASKPGIGAIRRAQKYMDSNDILIVDPKKFCDREFGIRVSRECTSRRANFAGQYGWMPKTPREVLRNFAGRIINAHPAPLDPAKDHDYDFGGQGMFGKRALLARLLYTRVIQRDPWTCATAHKVGEEYDRGDIVGEAMVPMYPETTLLGLESRMKAAEGTLHVEILRNFSQTGEFQKIEHNPGWLVRNEHERDVLLLAKLKADDLIKNPSRPQ